MLLRRKMDPKAGRSEVQERAVITMSSNISLSSIIEVEKWGDDSQTKCSVMLE